MKYVKTQEKGWQCHTAWDSSDATRMPMHSDGPLSCLGLFRDLKLRLDPAMVAANEATRSLYRRPRKYQTARTILNYTLGKRPRPHSNQNTCVLFELIHAKVSAG